MENYVVKFNSYTKKYGGNIVLNNINFTLKEGVACGIIGRNGSGKTLLLKAICGLINSTEGVFVKNFIDCPYPMKYYHVLVGEVYWELKEKVEMF